MTEFELIKHLTQDIPKQAKGLSQGIGDDCAVIEGEDHDIVITSDMLLEGVHFDLNYTSFYLLGRKAVSVNLSDIAAMGGQPTFFTISIGVPKEVGANQIKELYQGILEKTKHLNVEMIGGDTTSSKKGLVISITMLGKVPKGRAVLRKGAKAGDSVYVTGELGGSALGLKCFQAGKTGDKAKPFLGKFNDPEPRLQVGQWLEQNRLATTMIDISDGLLGDLGHIAKVSGVGYKIVADLLPLADYFQEMAKEIGVDPVELALAGGEDYELAFTVSAKDQQRLEKSLLDDKNSLKCRITKIGEVLADQKQHLIVDEKGNQMTIPVKGYDHFR